MRNNVLVLKLRFLLGILTLGSIVLADPPPGTTPVAATSVPPATSSGTPTLASSSSQAPEEPLRLGIDNLVAQGFAPIKGKQIALVTNQTGVDSRGKSTADILANAPGVKLIALFSPEHGIRGVREAGQPIGDTIDSRTRLPVYSLYGAVQKPTAEMLNAVDLIVFDMQDVGARFYTYLTTMALCMEAAANRHIGFVVLDRPNPVGGDVAEGLVLDPHIRHFTAYFSVPVRHGLTAGEMAQWYNQAATLKSKLQIVKMSGWKRSDLWEDTGLNFVPPSPNIRSSLAALLYSGVGMFEATNVSVGRGTDAPFERIGAPWMNGVSLTHRLNQVNLPGVKFVQTRFVPTKDIYQGQMCSGVRILVTDPIAVRPVDIFVHVACFLRELSPKDFQPRWDEMPRVTGSKEFETMYKDNRSAHDIVEVFHKSAEQFLKDRKPYLLY